MSGGLPLGTKYLSWAPWNMDDKIIHEKGECPYCGKFESFYAWTKIKSKWEQKWICKNCWAKYDQNFFV